MRIHTWTGYSSIIYKDEIWDFKLKFLTDSGEYSIAKIFLIIVRKQKWSNLSSYKNLCLEHILTNLRREKRQVWGFLKIIGICISEKKKLSLIQIKGSLFCEKSIYSNNKMKRSKDINCPHSSEYISALPLLRSWWHDNSSLHLYNSLISLSNRSFQRANAWLSDRKLKDTLKKKKIHKNSFT